MSFKVLVGLNIINDESFQSYRAGMTPILESYGATFLYDFTIDKTLKSQATHIITRLFLMSFPDEDTRQRFFQDERYRQIRHEFFDPAVEGRTVIAEFRSE